MANVRHRGLQNRVFKDGVLLMLVTPYIGKIVAGYTPFTLQHFDDV